jgi:GTPase SAR1 family protein
LQVNGSKDISILLIGNKNDLEDKRKVTQDEAEQKAKNHKVGFMETSAKSGDNLDKAFETLVHSIFDSSKRKAEKNEKVENKEEKGIEIDTKINKKKQEGGCC